MSRSLAFLLCLLFLVVAGCRKDSENPVDSGHPAVPTILTTIAGIVSDENGEAMSNAAVFVHGQTVTTDEYGFFIVRNARVPVDRCLITARKNGYFSGWRAETPKAGGITNIRLSLMSNRAKYSVQAAQGGTIVLEDGGSMELPASGFITDNGQPYTGKVNIAARRLNPADSTFYHFFPGDFNARRADGSSTILYSYGVLNVELMTEDGGQLNLAPGKRAVLRCPIAAEMLQEAPSEIPLWYFDESAGMWQEEGRALRQGSEYVGEVSHFTPWNYDEPMQEIRPEPGVVKGRVLCGNAPVPNIWVHVGQHAVMSDNEGNYEDYVIPNRGVLIQVYAYENFGSQTLTPVVIDMVGERQTVTQDIVISPCPAFVVGTLVDCNNKPVEGYIQFKTPKHFSYALPDANGNFKVQVEPSADVEVRAVGFDGQTSSFMLPPVGSGELKEIDTVRLCSSDPPAFFNISLDKVGSAGQVYQYMALSEDGKRVVVAGTNELLVFDTEPRTLVRRIAVGSSLDSIAHLHISPDNTKCLATVMQKKWGGNQRTMIWDIQSGQLLATLNVKDALFTSNVNAVIGIKNQRDNILYVYDISTGNLIKSIEPEFPEPSGEVTLYNRYLIRTVAQGKKVVISSYYDNSYEDTPISRLHYTSVVYLDIETGTTLLTWNDKGGGVAYFPQDATDNGGVLGRTEWGNMFVDAVQMKIRMRARGVTALSPDAKYHVVQSGEWDPVAIYSTAQTGSLERYLPLPVAGSQVYSLAYSADGTMIAGLWQGKNHAGVCIWHP